jgi:hypothetical protein
MGSAPSCSEQVLRKLTGFRQIPLLLLFMANAIHEAGYSKGGHPVWIRESLISRRKADTILGGGTVHSIE